ncbi:MAG: hypothetical protein U9R40_05530 [Synergistota bacterium]|nr:hypothetical protein [Synergistota bacterium]
MENKRENAVTGNLSCTSNICTLVEYDVQALRDLIDDFETGWVEKQTHDKC